MQGKIIKGIAGFYYVDVAESGVYECKAKGIFRKEKKKPLVGDNVEIEVLDEKEKTGNLIQILPRKNELIRPAAANVDQALVIFAVRQPDPNYQLLDRFLITMEQQEIPSIICFNKKDLAEQEELDQMYQIYISCGYQVLLTSAEQEEGISQIRKILEGKTTVVAGPSGVGKSSLTNLLQEEVSMETGEISKTETWSSYDPPCTASDSGRTHLSDGYTGIQFSVCGENGKRGTAVPLSGVCGI